MSLLRRRMMMQQQEQQSEWDIEWDYTMGLLEDNGLEKLIVGKAYSEIKSGGLELYGGVANDYIRFSPVIKRAKKQIVEAVVIPKNFADSNGFRLLISNGEYGCQIYIYSRGLYIESAGKILLSKLKEDTEYKIKMEFDESVGTKVFLDDVQLSKSNNFSKNFCTENRVFQQSGGITILKSLKYKFS